MEIPIEQILERLDSLECKFEQLVQCYSQKEATNFPALLTLDGLVEYLFHKTARRPAKATIYGWINKKSVPYIKRNHTVLFERDRIDGWLISGRTLTYDEIIMNAGSRMVIANRHRKRPAKRYQ
jgi:hypothetical protein